jgi:Transglycosylase SLT domain
VPSLPPVSEDFTADSSGYLAAIQEMIDETRRLIDTVNELHAVIDALPDLKEIEVNVTGDALETIAAIREELGDLDDRTIVVNVVYRNGGGPDIRDATQVVYEETVGRGGDVVNENLNLGGVTPDQISDDVSALDQMIAATQRETDAFYSNLAAIHQQTMALRGQSESTELSAAAMDREALAAYNLDQAMSQAQAEIDEINTGLVAYYHSLQDVNQAEEEAAEEQIRLAEAQEAWLQSAYDAEAETRAQSDAMKDLEADLNDTSAAILRNVDHNMALMRTEQQLAANTRLLLQAIDVLGLQAGDASLNLGVMSDAVMRAAQNSDNAHGVLLAMAQAASQAGDSTGTAGINMLAMATAAKKMGDNMGGVTIPLGAAAFGITGLGTAIHLIIMGIFEFSAVFIPAMVAAGAAAAVLNQGFMDVYDGLKGVETAGEALGPMFGKTQGDMIGLGHSLQIAQNAADPDAYELLGEAIQGVNDATGHLNDQLGAVTHTAGTASGGISSFGQMGLAVGGILERFAADIDIDLQNGMTQFTGLLASGVQDLVEFGQIFGNIGRAILNLASDMPGLAEIILKIIDGISDLIKVISELPAGLIAVVMGIEEAYRWSGLLVGVFGLIGRSLALIGTLGIPVFAKIGLNMGAMVANVLTGIGDMVVNFVAMGERVGVFGAKVDEAATSLVGGLGDAAAFMSGPWGAAVMLGVAGLTALTIWFLRSKSGAEDFISGIQAAVQSATNLNALNVISQSLTQNTVQLNAAQNTLNSTLNATNNVMKAAGPVIVSTSSQTGIFGDVIQTLSGWLTGSTTKIVTQATAVNQLSSEQQNLFQQSQNVISGAEMISKAYGMSFTSALGMADAANVKLVNGISGNSKAAEEARIQIQGLYQGYRAMDQSGSTLSNSLQAVSVQAQLQGTKVSALNSAWDAFMNDALGLTGSFSQINLDLQQMGNIASTTPDKISAFAGATTLSVNQIAESLKGFKGTSAQTWQAYNQSLSEAETFTDSLRTAAASNVVTQGQFVQAISGVVNMMLPYAKDSSTAVAELSILAQEAGGPATSNFATLKGWVDQTGGATVNLGGLVDNLTSKLSNVTAVAKTFAGTLQSDVLSAIANAAVGTSSITGLTQKYTDALQQNGNTSPITTSAQDALEKAMEKLGFTQTEAKQTTDELSTAYNNNTAAADNQTGSVDTLNNAAETLSSTFNGKSKLAVDTLRSHTDDLTQQYISGLMPAIGGVGDKAKTTATGPLAKLQEMTESIHSWTQQTENVMRMWPASEHTNVSVTGTGGASIHSNIPGVPGGMISIQERLQGYAAGGVLPGYDPGHDTIPAMLSAGEGILTPDAVRAIGGARTIDMLNARHFADGGMLEEIASDREKLRESLGKNRLTRSWVADEKADEPLWHLLHEWHEMHLRHLESGRGVTGAAVSGLTQIADARDKLRAGLGKNRLAQSWVADEKQDKSLWHMLHEWHLEHLKHVRGYASGGLVLPNITGTAGDILTQGEDNITDAFKSVLTTAMQHFQNEYNSYAQTQLGMAPGAHYPGTLMGWLTSALTADGAPQSWLPALAWLATAESSGNPNAVDPILVGGQHAEGLLQTLPSTFAEFANPALDGGIWNPIANAAAAIRYIESAYGSPFNIPGMFHRDKGYDSGGWLMPGLTLARNNTGQPERVIGPNESRDAGVIHSVVNLDGKQIFESMKPYVYQYNARNNGAGNISGAWAPNRTGNTTR